jgi:anaerobic magnesium-protoporphyrin IX monomethyl ester cyclase
MKVMTAIHLTSNSGTKSNMPTAISAENADLTLINLNLLYVRYLESVDRELHVPLGCLYLTRALEDAGYRVDFRDYQLNDFDDPFEIHRISEFLGETASIVGFSCMANLLPFTIMAMKKFKEENPDKFLVLGGVGPKAVEEKIMQRFPWIDCIAVGEGEKTGPELIKALVENKDLMSVRGLFVRDSSGNVIFTGPRSRIENLDHIPLPAFEKIDLKRYQGYGMLSSRGCPYPCTFCSVAPVWDHYSTFRSNDSIIEEMKMLSETAGVKMFLFQDEFFVSTKSRVLDFCDKLKKTGLKVYWKAFGRVDLTDTEMMQAMADSGCVELRFGIESGSDNLLRLIKKGFSAADAVAVVSEAVKIFPRVDAFYVWGFPEETMEDFHQTVFQMVMFRMMGARILPSLLCILPQTELFIKHRDSFNLDFCTELFPEYMITGHEISAAGKFDIAGQHADKYAFIKENPDIFPGFFHFNLEGNILPKLAVMRKFGFYPETEPESTESCGAHSPRQAAQNIATPQCSRIKSSADCEFWGALKSRRVACKEALQVPAPSLKISKKRWCPPIFRRQ